MARVAADSSSKYYITNKDMHQEMVLSNQQNELTPRALGMMILIANRISLRLVYVNPDDRKDCVQQAMYDCLVYWRKYDVSIANPNPFAYFSQMSKNGLAKGWRILHKDMHAKDFVRLSNKIWTI